MLVWRFAALLGVITALRQGPAQLPLRLRVGQGGAELRTSVSTYELRDLDNTVLARLQLFSTLHVAEPEYYEQIVKQTKEADAVLYELITSRANKELVGSDSSSLRRLKTDIMSPGAEKLAAQFELTTQLSLPLLSAPNWYIADLDAETVRVLEMSRQQFTNAEFVMSQIAGRSTSPVLRKFFLSDAAFVTAARLLSWVFLPCPELNILLLDWSRDRNSGLPKAIGPLLQLIFSGQIALAKKLAFAQTLCSGVPDSGSWGGEARSDVEVRVRGRNKECARIVAELLAEYKQNRGIRTDTTAPPTIAVLYGAYHVADLHGRFVKAGLRLIESEAREVVAWRIPTTNASLSLGSALLASVCGIVYLVLGTLDWAFLLKLLLDIASGAERLAAEENPAFESIFVAAYLYLYYWRHRAVLRAYSSLGIAWDRGLFEEGGGA